MPQYRLNDSAERQLIPFCPAVVTLLKIVAVLPEFVALHGMDRQLELDTSTKCICAELNHAPAAEYFAGCWNTCKLTERVESGRQHGWMSEDKMLLENVLLSLAEIVQMPDEVL